MMVIVPWAGPLCRRDPAVGSGAVGRDDRAADRRGQVAGEEGDDVRDRLRLDGAGQLLCGERGPVGGRVDELWRDRVDPDAARAQLQVENADEVAESRLAEAVGRQAGSRVDSRTGRHVHDGALAALAHVRLHRLAQPQRRAQIDIHQDLQVLGRRGDRLAQAERADGVDQHLRRASHGGYPVHEALGRGRVGRVAHLTADAVGQFLQSLLVAVDPDHRVPGACQGLRGGPAELSPGADNDCHALANIGQHLVSPFGYGRTCRRPSSAQPETTTPSPTRMANPSTVSGALAPRSSATPAPITGTASPTYSAMSRSDVMATRLSGGLAPSTIPVVPLKTAPEPAPISAPAIRNSARLGVDRRTETTSSVRPASMEVVPSASTRDAGNPPVASWDATPAAKTRKSAAPASACEFWCSVVARKTPDSPANRPFAEKAARVPAAAGTGSLTLRGGSAG